MEYLTAPTPERLVEPFVVGALELRRWPAHGQGQLIALVMSCVTL